MRLTRSPPAPAQSQPPHPYRGDALARWKVVHRAFFVIIDFILIGLTRLEMALVADRPAEVRLALLRLETLLLGSAVALRLAGDFPGTEYGPKVRDDMAAFDPEFSGSFSADHARMIKRIAVLSRVPPYAADEHGRVLSALDAVYRNHAWVCESFVGAKPSLAQGDGTQQSGVDLLVGQFRRRALHRAGCPSSTGITVKSTEAVRGAERHAVLAEEQAHDSASIPTT